MFDLEDREYEYISQAVYDYAKINLTQQKRPLIVSRLSKRIRKLNLQGFPQYVDYLKKDSTGREFLTMVDSLSTNFSHFFREPHHFEFLKENLLKDRGNRELLIWSAASSTGQEIYSVLMTILEYEKENKKKINYSLYASDISRQVLEKASRGIYQIRDTEGVPRPVLEEYFLKGKGDNEDMAKIKKQLVARIRFFRLNLNDKTYKLPAMDVIFLRNAIIYFDLDTKKELVERLYDYIKPRGYLILGHSESLSGICDKFELIGKTIYRRID